MSVQWIVIWDGLAACELPEASDTIEAGRHVGIACARNLGISHIQAPFVAILDADDLVVPSGCQTAAQALQSDASIGWVGLNRTFIDETPTRHWRDDPQTFRAGELATSWTAPFVFHPNSVMMRTSLLCQIGGWPAIPTNEDLGMVLVASEHMGGTFLPDVITRYRVWEKQEVSQHTYELAKMLSFSYIEVVVNAVRESLGRAPIRAPEHPGGAFGVMGRS